MIRTKYIRQAAVNELDRLRQLHKKAKENWADFVARYQHAAPWVAPNYAEEHGKILMEKLPTNLQQQVATLPPDASLTDMVDRLNNVLYWTDRSNDRGKASDPMDLGVAEAGNRADYKPVFSGSRINFRNITGPKTLMMA